MTITKCLPELIGRECRIINGEMYHSHQKITEGYGLIIVGITNNPAHEYYLVKGFDNGHDGHNLTLTHGKYDGDDCLFILPETLDIGPLSVSKEDTLFNFDDL